MSLDKYKDSFITFNIKPKENDVEIDIINAKMPDENVLFLIGKDLKYLWDFDIKNFNFIIFENDIENINDSEFEYFWTKFFIPWIERLNENYFEIDLDKFNYQLSNTYEKKFLIKKIIHFLMMFFPYYIIKNIFENHSMENKQQAFDLLKIWEENPKSLRQDIDEQFSEVLNKSKNLLSSLTSLLQYTKKGELEHSLDLLERQLNKQDVYLQLFLEFLNQTSIDKIINLITEYIKADFENLI